MAITYTEDTNGAYDRAKNALTRPTQPCICASRQTAARR